MVADVSRHSVIPHFCVSDANFGKGTEEDKVFPGPYHRWASVSTGMSMLWPVGFFEADVMQHFHLGKVGFPKLFGGYLFVYHILGLHCYQCQ